MSTLRITDRDRRLLAFAAEHRFVMADHIATLLQTSSDAADVRLRSLAAAGYLRDWRLLRGVPTLFQVRTAALRAIGSDLPGPRRIDLATVRHDAGLAWLHVGAERGMFGPLAQIVSERRMRSQDRRGDERPDRFGVRLRTGGRDGLHYPDLMIVTETGHRIAFELELTTKPARRREAILGAYSLDRRIDAVVYLVDTPARQRAMQESARRVGIADRVRVERVTLDPRLPLPAEGRGSERSAGRTSAAGAGR